MHSKDGKNFFKKRRIKNFRELTEGYFNAAYLVELDDGSEFVLKVAPKADIRIMTYEKNVMVSEVKAMEMVDNYGNIPLPKLLGYDDSKKICKTPYFCMEKLPGNSLNSIQDTFTPEQLEKIYVRLGEINKRINEIECPYFGYPGQVEFQGKVWYPVFYSMMEAGLIDADKGNVVPAVSKKELLQHLEYDKDCFYEVKVPKLIHWDLWDGNVFIKDGGITGLIDWERSIWGDPLLEVGFRSYSDNKAFLKGYGISEFTPMQERRRLWYDIYLLLLMSLECEYRGYETFDMYEWSSRMMKQQFKRILSLQR